MNGPDARNPESRSQNREEERRGGESVEPAFRNPAAREVGGDSLDEGQTAPLTGSGLWDDDRPSAWREALERYPKVIEAQGVNRLSELDRWYREELPPLITARHPAQVTLDELVRATEWKMKRGVWRQRNLVLVRSNPPEVVEQTSRDALSRVPDPLAPIRALAKLAGVGPATASAIASAAAPDVYPFFDELVANQVPGLGPVDFSVSYYARYAAALRDRAQRLGDGWTPTMVERALWAHAGGKGSDKSSDHERRESERENARKA